MPREITHWEVCRQTILSLRKDNSTEKISNILENNKSFFLLGAMAYDAPFYFQGGSTSFEKIASILHGQNRNDTKEPLRKLYLYLEQSSKNMELKEKLWSFYAGMLTHYVTDITFHPMVFYFTGDYHSLNLDLRAEARRKHRLFETLLDIYVSNLNKDEYFLNFSRLLNVVKEDLEEICLFLQSAFLNEEESSVLKWQNAFFHMSFFEKIFKNNFCGFLSLVFSKFVPGFRAIDAMFLFKKKNFVDFFGKEISYLDPISGKREDVRIDQLLELSVKRSKDFIVSVDFISGKGLEKNKESLPLELLEKGLSLDMGQQGVNSNDARFFNTSELYFLES